MTNAHRTIAHLLAATATTLLLAGAGHAHAQALTQQEWFARQQAQHQAQMAWFARQQAAHNAQVGANAAQLAMIQRNSDARLAAANRFDHTVIRGESQYVNPQTGQAQWMPSYAPGQVQTFGGYSYVQAPNGTYWQQQGGYWYQVQPTGR